MWPLDSACDARGSLCRYWLVLLATPVLASPSLNSEPVRCSAPRRLGWSTQYTGAAGGGGDLNLLPLLLSLDLEGKGRIQHQDVLVTVQSLGENLIFDSGEFCRSPSPKGLVHGVLWYHYYEKSVTVFFLFVLLVHFSVSGHSDTYGTRQIEETLFLSAAVVAIVILHESKMKLLKCLPRIGLWSVCAPISPEV